MCYKCDLFNDVEDGKWIDFLDKLIELVEKISNLIPEGSQELKEEMKNNIRIILEDYLQKLNLVSREEFEVQKKIIQKLQQKIGLNLSPQQIQFLSLLQIPLAS